MSDALKDYMSSNSTYRNAYYPVPYEYAFAFNLARANTAFNARYPQSKPRYLIGGVGQNSPRNTAAFASGALSSDPGSPLFKHETPTSCPFSISQQHCLALALLFHLPPYLVPLQLTHRAYPVDAALDVRVLTPPPSFPLPRSITFAKSTQWTLWFLSFSTHGKSRFSPSSPNGISQS
jgi:hypothetical protein